MNAAHREIRQQMLDSYLAYFRANYTGNRAPIHIGHHFSDYQNGAYRDALKSFARAVCGLPEVRCVTYKTLADFMDGLSEQKLADYRTGQFDRATMPAILVSSGVAMPLSASGILNFRLRRSTVRQSSPAWKARPFTRRRPAVTKRLAMSRSRRL